MYSAEGSSNSDRRMNYYVPRDEIKPYKKSLDSCSKSHYRSCILVCRFALTRPASFVELHLGDIRGNHLTLSHEMWETFMERRVDIERFLQSNTPSSLRIEYLVMEHVKIHDASVVKLTVDDSCLYMKPLTVLFLFELEHCINHEYLKLYEKTEDVNAIFDQFVQEDAVKILREFYDKRSVIYCELVAYAVDELLCETLKQGDVW
ncbi:hypothetical protein ACFW04_012079 [Cataglyphis niger]